MIIQMLVMRMFKKVYSIYNLSIEFSEYNGTSNNILIYRKKSKLILFLI